MLATQTYSAYWQERLKPQIDTQEDIHDRTKGKPLLRIPSNFLKDTGDFVNYICETAKKTFEVFGHKISTGQPTKPRIIPYIHRWTAPYRKSIVAKLCQLELSLGNDITDVEFITLTIPQRHLDQEEALLTLNNYRHKLFDVLGHAFNRPARYTQHKNSITGELYKWLASPAYTVNYFYILEPHKSGYAHIHMLYFKKLTEEQKEHLKTLWADKYFNGAKGAKEHGLTFAEPRASKNKRFKEGSISYIKGYILKYISKGLNSEDGGISKMKPNELLFNSLLKKHKVKLWGASRALSQIMSWKNSPSYKPKDEDFECDVVNMRYDEEFQANVWKREDKKESDTCGVCTENNSTDWDDDEGSIVEHREHISAPKIERHLKPCRLSRQQIPITYGGIFS